MNPIACLFLDGAHREPARTAVVALRVHARRVEVQVEAVSSIVRSGRPKVAVRRDTVQLTIAVEAGARGRDEERLVTRRVSRAEVTARRLFARGTYPVPVYIGCTTLGITIRRESRESVTVRKLFPQSFFCPRGFNSPMNPIACLFLDGAHREPVRTVVVVLRVHVRRVEVQIVAVSSIVRSGRPIVAVRRDIEQLTIAVVAAARDRDEERQLRTCSKGRLLDPPYVQ